MDFQALRFFQSVAKAGSISKAAKELNYAQSNITTKMQQLEADLQTTLFYRHNRGTDLTDKGTLLLSYTEELFQRVEEIKEVMRDDQKPTGSLTIGSMETTAAVRLPSLLSTYHQSYPEVDLMLKTGPTEQNVHHVLQHELDGAFVAGPIEHPNLAQQVVVEEELVLVTDAPHPPLSAIKDIQNRTVLAFRRGCSYRAKLEQWLHHEGVMPKKTMEFGTLDGIIGCVSAGLGISLLPWSVVEKHVQEGQLSAHPIPPQFGCVQTLFVYRHDHYMPASLVKWLEMLSIETDKIRRPVDYGMGRNK